MLFSPLNYNSFFMSVQCWENITHMGSIITPPPCVCTRKPCKSATCSSHIFESSVQSAVFVDAVHTVSPDEVIPAGTMDRPGRNKQHEMKAEVNTYVSIPGPQYEQIQPDYFTHVTI